jgi:hypothetical protein
MMRPTHRVLRRRREQLCAEMMQLSNIPAQSLNKSKTGSHSFRICHADPSQFAISSNDETRNFP